MIGFFLYNIIVMVLIYNIAKSFFYYLQRVGADHLDGRLEPPKGRPNKKLGDFKCT